jgi:mannose-6-phosphate isomerase-like protein (cupin superfamily)
MSNLATNQVHVVPRNAIPPIHSVAQGGEVHELGELRDFRWNEQLRSFMPAESRFSVSWVRLEHEEVLQVHVHPIHSMMIFYSGSGTMLGDLNRAVAKNDVVVVPAGCQHGFVGGPEGLFGLSIQFGEGLYTKPEEPRVLFMDGEHTLESLLAYNEERVQQFARGRVFELLTDGTLDDPCKRKLYLDALQIWVDGNQTLLFSRQATCLDPTYKDVFFRHMQEELGHDVLHKQRSEGERATESRMRDPVMEAVTNWFAYQMYVLDNSEKTAIIHLVIENASSVYHARAMPALSKYISQEYFDVHVENDDEHAAMGIELLRHESPRSYARLQQIVGEAWDMIGMMTDRLVELTRSDDWLRASSGSDVDATL